MLTDAKKNEIKAIADREVIKQKFPIEEQLDIILEVLDGMKINNPRLKSLLDHRNAVKNKK